MEDEARPATKTQLGIHLFGPLLALGAALLSLGLAFTAPGCTRTCLTSFDCGDEGYCSPATGSCVIDCFTDQDCRKPPTCAEDSPLCEPLGFRCNSFNRCIDGAPPVFEKPDIVPFVEDADGFADPPGSGYTFIVNRLAIAGHDTGFDIDGSCANGRDHKCADNALSDLGEYGNDQIRSGLLTGATLLLIEIAGIDEPYKGNDASVSVKIYAARDADNPPVVANNFSPLNGSGGACCDFLIAPGSLTSAQTARSVLPAKIVNGTLIPLRPTFIEFALAVGDPPHQDVRFDNAFIGGHLSYDLTEITTGLLGGAVPMRSLANTANPYCRQVSPRCVTSYVDATLLDLVSALIAEEPDIDLDDSDGIECVVDTDGDGHIDLCCDGAGEMSCTDGLRKSCTSMSVPAFDPTDPASCAQQLEMADGYSIAIDFTAVRAHIVGQ